MTDPAEASSSASTSEEANASASSGGSNPQMVETVRAALDQWGLTYELVSNDTMTQINAGTRNVQIIEFNMTGVHSSYRALISMDPSEDIFAFYYLSPIKIVAERRVEMARFLASANYKLMLGHFDLDFSDGEVRFKVSTILKGARISQDMVKQYIAISMKSMDKYFPGILACAFGDLTAEACMQEVQNPQIQQQQQGGSADITAAAQ